jgi:hypothetical protein
MRAMPASVWEWPRDRKRVTLVLRRCPMGRRRGVSPRHAGRRACTDNAPLRGLLVPVATLVDLRHTARHGTAP